MSTTKTRRVTNILSEILEWSGDLPGWHQDALRRIVENGTLSREDIDELTALCRHSNGLTEKFVPKFQPLRAEHIPAGPGAGHAVTLCSISNIENVNALDRSQELTFSPKGLTIVFGYNGSGKSGYGRILRRACRARSKGESILPNVLKASTGTPASAEIFYSLNGTEQPPEQWIDSQRQIEALGSISFFDSDCAAAHVRNSNDIAFTPFGLDVLPKLGAACKEVQKKLDAEKKLLEGNQPHFLNAIQRREPTAVSGLLTSLRHDTAVERIEAYASLTDEELRRLKDIPVQLAVDPLKVAKEIRARASRISSLRAKLGAAANALSLESLQKVKDLARDLDHKSKAADVAAKLSFSGDPLPAIGDAIWRELWDVARKYSAIAYPDQLFPVTDTEDAVCVLCQQVLGHEAKSRLQRFEAFVSDDTARQAKAAAFALTDAVGKIQKLGLQDEALRDQLLDVEAANADTHRNVQYAIQCMIVRSTAIQIAHQSSNWDFVAGDEFGDFVSDMNAVVAQLERQAVSAAGSADLEQRKKLEQELAELKAKEWLATVVGDVKEHIMRLCAIKKLKDCISQTSTTKITKKSKELAKEYVTDQLRDAFAAEVKKMQQGIRRLNVELAATAGELGSSYYCVQLVGAPKADIGAVVSEGEHRCIALAGFLSELATEKSQSAIVFDDPVTSLDHHWRECFAKRLVEEAANRQVIVFTHDIVFLHDLLSGAERTALPPALRRVTANREHCGYVSEGLPWIAQKTLPRINELEHQARATRGDFDSQNDDVYDRDICSVYSDLRATIERAVEEHLFRGIVLRHRDYISISSLQQVTAVTTDHCERLKRLFQRCCDITEAHDRSSIRSFGVPTPDDAIADLAELRAVVDDVKLRQKQIA